MRHLVWLCAVGLCVTLGPFVGSSRAAENEPTTQPAMDPKVKAILQRMSKTLVEAKTFSVNIEGHMKVTNQGVTNETISHGSLAVERPNNLALRSDGRMEGAVVADGKTVYTYLALTGKYTEQEQSGPVAELQHHQGTGMIASSMGGGGVLAILAEDPAAELMEGVTKAVYVGREMLAEVPVEHLRFEQEQFDWELWVQAEGDALPLKQATDLAKMMKQGGGLKDMKPEFYVLLRDWKLNAQLPADTFKFTPPDGAEKADSLLDRKNSSEPEDDLLGGPAPKLKLPLLDGGTLDVAALKGKNIVVLDFWATWCGPCVMSLPVIAKVTADYKDKGVLFYAVNQQENADTIRGFLKSKKLTIAVALDKDGRAGGAYGVSGIPHTVILGKDGTVQAKHTGYSPEMKSELKKQLETLIADKKLAEPRSAKTKPSNGEKVEEAQGASAGDQNVPALTALWSAEGPYSAVAALPGSRTVIALSREDKAVEIDSAGASVGQHALPDAGSAIRVGNLTGDAAPELVTFDHWGKAVNAADRTGKPLWNYPGGQGIDDVWLADLDGDSHSEVIVGHNGMTGLHVLDGAGKQLWENTQLGNIWHVCAGDVADNEGAEVITTSAVGRIHVFSSRGQKIKDLDPKGYANMVRIAHGADPAAKAAMIAVTGGKGASTAIRIDMDGKVLWRTVLSATDEYVGSAIAAQSMPWLAIGCRGGRTQVLNVDTGKIIAAAKLHGNEIDLAWLEGDKDTKQPLLIAAVGNKLVAFKMPAE